jgi:hypothetical protein
MKKVVRLTEKDLNRLVNKVIEEQHVTGWDEKGEGGNTQRGMGLKDPELTSGDFLGKVKNSPKKTGTCTFNGTDWIYTIDGVQYKHIDSKWKNPGFSG